MLNESGNIGPANVGLIYTTRCKSVTFGILHIENVNDVFQGVRFCRARGNGRGVNIELRRYISICIEILSTTNRFFTKEKLYYSEM